VSSSGPVADVVELLGQANYELVPMPGPIAGITFDFAAMLAAPASLDLIAVVDLVVDTDRGNVGRRIEALGRALDLVRSRRSLTVVFVGVWPGRELIQRVAQVGRVLAPGRPDDLASLRHALAVLAPLELGHESTEASSPWPAARAELVAAHSPESAQLLDAARSGDKALRAALREILMGPLEAVEAEVA